MKPSDLQELKRLAAEATPGGWESVATRYATEKVGDVEEVKGPLRLCGAGALHATLEPGKWRGPKVWVVALYGEVIEEADKLGALKREIIGVAWEEQ